MYLAYVLNIDILPDILNNDILNILILYSYPNRGNKTNGGWGELLW